MCLAFSARASTKDIDDVRYLLKNLGITKYEKAIALIAKFYPIEKFPKKTLYVLEEFLDKK